LRGRKTGTNDRKGAMGSRNPDELEAVQHLEKIVDELILRSQFSVLVL
jgi:hypothetical protein